MNLDCRYGEKDVLKNFIHVRADTAEGLTKLDFRHERIHL